MIKALIVLALLQGADPYAEGCEKALRENRPMVTGIGCAPPAGRWVTSLAAKLPGFPAPSIAVSVPKNGYLIWVETLHPTATVEEIEASIQRHREAQRRAEETRIAPQIIRRVQAERC